MKLYENIIAYCSCLLLMCIAFVNATAGSVAIIGDVNGDGDVDIADGVAIVSYIVGRQPEPFYADAADIDGDGSVDIADAVRIISKIVGKESPNSIDTIRVTYNKEIAIISGNYDKKRIKASVKDAVVKVTSSGSVPFVCMAEGESNNGCLTINADTAFTLILNNLQLHSSETAAISLTKKQKVRVELPKDSYNTLTDASTREDNDGANACLYSKGTLSFSGTGTLEVNGNYSHGISSSKNITVDGSHIVIGNAVKHGIHSDKFTLQKGQIDITLNNNAAKGIKAKEDIIINGGSIVGEAKGDIIDSEGDLSYSALLKSDGSLTVSDGMLTLTNYSRGGRCISVDNDMTVTGGTIVMECLGDGGQYLNTDGEQDYFTPKCITADDSLIIAGGTVNCMSTGLGGKGIVAGRYLSIGSMANDENDISPVVKVETSGECIINDEDEDRRFGCPKGIKCDSMLIIYDGDIVVTTAGMGGEGIESNDSMFVYGGNVECITFDDGINVANAIEIAGGMVYCNSADNDGIDSNGSITISGGIVASVNQQKPNESLDSDNGRTYLMGGTVFGIGSGPVDVAQSVNPCYTTSYDISGEEGIRSRGLILTEGQYVCVRRGQELVMALRNDNKAFRSFITFTSANLQDGEIVTLCEGESPADANQTLFGGRLLFGGTPNNANEIMEIIVRKIN